jgi:hypothetical protein
MSSQPDPTPASPAEAKNPTSASLQMHSNKLKDKWHKIKKPVFFLAVILVVGFVVWFVLNNYVGWPYKNLTVDGTKYSFRFDRASKQVDKEGTPFLQGNDLNNQNLINVSIQKVSGISDCSAYLTAGFSVKVGKKQYPVCPGGEKFNFVYFSNFEKNGSWYSVTILSEDEKTRPDETTVKKIISSIKVKQ